MKKVIVITSIALLTGCASVKEWIPVRWDANQSQAITTIQQSTRRFDCAGDIAQQSQSLSRELEWFQIYAENKPTRDVIEPAKLMAKTVNELVERSSKGKVSVVYCDIKKKIMVQQADMIAHTVQGRF